MRKLAALSSEQARVRRDICTLAEKTLNEGVKVSGILLLLQRGQTYKCVLKQTKIYI